MIKKLAVALTVLFSAQAVQSQTILFEEDFNDGIPATWSTYDVDGLVPNSDVSEFDNAWIGKIVGSDTAAVSTSYYEPTGQSDDYLVTPKLSIGNFSRFIWSARSVDASHPDGYQVLISTTDSLPASFTDTLLTIGAESPLLAPRTIELDLEGYNNQDVYIAFRNITENGYILLIDNVKLLGAETASIAKQVSQEVEVTVYPNPASDFIQIRSASTFQSAHIYSADGKLQSIATTTSIDIQSLENGTYIMKILTAEGQSSVRFIKH